MPSGPPQEGNWGKVLAKFKEDGSVQLQNFLRKEWAEQVAQVRRGGALGTPRCACLGPLPARSLGLPTTTVWARACSRPTSP